MEPLQERATKVIAQAEEEKKNMVKIQIECGEIIRKEVTVQEVDSLREKTA